MVVKNILYLILLYIICFIADYAILKIDVANIKLQQIIMCIVAGAMSLITFYLFKRKNDTNVFVFITGIVLSQFAVITAIFMGFAITFHNFN